MKQWPEGIHRLKCILGYNYVPRTSL